MSSPDIKTWRLPLSDGNQMPIFGLGVWQSPEGRPTIDAVKTAIQTGYRLIDTAALYRNEKEVGQGIRESGAPRSEIFVTTKLWNDDQGYDKALRAFDKSFKNIGLEYIDLYLLHFPVPGKRLESWRALQEIKKSGRVKSIGVSNFMTWHLKEFFENSDVRPVLNQVEFSPFLYVKDLLEMCQKNEIVLQAYAPLTRGERFEHPVIIQVAKKYKKTPAQILLRWGLEHGISVIPKSVNPSRIKENADIFDFHIEPKEMKVLDQLNENLRTSWDPTTTP